MKKLGIQATPVDAEEVIIRTPTKEIIITNPEVSKVSAFGQETF
ncbi:nascent polypeptide-associated complex protein, partial [Candidatus Aerophobetes bacterium]